MFSPKPQLIRRFCLLFCLLFSLIKLYSQCNPPDQLPTVQCVDAPLTCLNNACYSTSNEDDEGWPAFCGNNTVIHNPQYFEIIPITDCIEIHIHVDACEDGTALQAALVTSCSWQPCPGGAVPCQDVLDCDPGTGVGGTMIIDACGLTPNVPLWLLIDGSSGSQCQYTIDFASGIFEPQIDEELTSGEAIPNIVCQGFDDLNMIVGPPITNAHGYFWILGWNGQIVTSTLPEIEIDIDNNAPPGIWEVCVQAFSGCDTSDIPFCFEIEIVEIDDVDKEPGTFCPEDFPFSWHNINISSPGTYMKTFDNPDGCPYDSIWEVEEYPEVPLGELNVLYCLNENFDPYFYEGETYDAAGTYDLSYPGMGLNGCDSMAELNLTLAGIDAIIELTCLNGEFVLTPQIQELIPFNAIIEWEWFESGSTIVIFDNIPLNLLDGGCYELHATIETPAGECTFIVDSPVCFNADEYWPAAPYLGFTDTIVCAQEGIFFTVIEDPFGEQLDYVWSAPSDVPVFQDGSNVVEMDFSNSAGGPVCVYAIGACGEGPSTCFNVDIQTTPIAAFSFETDVCNDSTTIITFTGIAGPNTQATWDFDSPDSVSGSGFGPYMVSWNINGDKVISLLLIQPGCDTSFTSGIVTVSNLLTPIVNCTSTIDSITFDWDDVVGASAYTISINGGPPIGTVTSSYIVTPLNPGDIVTLTLTVLSAGPCDNIVVTTTCTAEDCPPPSIILSGIDSACLNAPMIITLSAVVNGSAGVGTWAGPGIVDAALGLFDPKVSGSGQHQVTFTADVNNCSFTEPYLMTVFDSLTADFTIDPLICITDLATVTYTGNASGSANYAFDFGSAIVVAGTGAGPYQLRFTTPGSKTVRLEVSDNGCTSELITQNLEVGATLNVPVVNCQPNTSGVKFCWNNDPLVSAYVVNTLTTQNGIITGNCIDFGGLNPGDSVAIEIISQTTGPCPQRADTFFCIARACPMPVINITPVPDVCLYPGTLPIDLEVIVVAGNGTGDWSGTGITDPVNGKFDPVIAGAGSHVITYHYLDDGCDFFEPITINVFDPPDAFISNTNFVLTCTSGSLVLDGSGSSGSNLIYEWTTDGVILSGENTSMAEAGAQGAYQLKVTDGISRCVDSITVNVTLDSNTPVAKSGEDKVITCDSTSFLLGGGSSTGLNIIYFWSTPDGNITGPVDGQQITVDAVGEYIIVVRDTSNGCQSSDRTFVTIDTSLADLTLTPGDTIDCNTSISGVQSSLNEPVADYNFMWTTIDGTIVGSDTTPDIDVSQGGTYTLTIENKDNGCEKSASAAVPESDEIIDVVDVSLMNITCFGDDNGALVINGVIGGIGPYTYKWSVSPQGGTSLSSLSPGQYSLTVTDQNGCSYTEVFNLTEPIQITVDVGPNKTVAVDDSVIIDLITNIGPNAIIKWGGFDGIICPECPKLEFIATSSATITAMVTDTAGCTAFDSMRLTVIVPRIIFIPTIFSPNGDGVNDNFTISGRRNLVNIGYLRIFDRWGNLLFEKNDLTPGVEDDGWDGRFNGEPMLPGVYVYIAELQYEDITETIKGGITIVR